MRLWVLFKSSVVAGIFLFLTLLWQEKRSVLCYCHIGFPTHLHWHLEQGAPCYYWLGWEFGVPTRLTDFILAGRGRGALLLLPTFPSMTFWGDNSLHLGRVSIRPSLTPYNWEGSGGLVSIRWGWKSRFSTQPLLVGVGNATFSVVFDRSRVLMV